MKHGVLFAVALLGAAGCTGRLDYDPSAYSVVIGQNPTLPPSMTPPEAGPPTLTPPPPDAGQPPLPSPDTRPPDPPPPPPKRDAGGSSDAPVQSACPPGMDPLEVMVVKCGSCHNESLPTKNLDLVTPGVAKRLVGITSTCDSRNFLEPPPAPARGYFLDKLNGPVENCGEMMPFAAPPLTTDEKACLFEWADKAVARGVTVGN